MMKYIGTMALFVVCIVVLVAGQIHWSDKIEQVSTTRAIAMEKKMDTNEKLPFRDVTDTQLKETMEWAAWDHSSARILIAGFDSLGTEDSGLAEHLNKALEDSFGDAVTVNLLQYAGNSIDFSAENKVGDYVDFKPDVLIYNPLLHNSNGVEDATMTTNDMIDTVLGALQAENKHLYTILTPPYPIYGSSYDPHEIDDLKEYAKKQNLAYVNHWSEWPEHQKEEIKNYLNDAQNPLNKESTEIWADEILKLFGL